VGVGPRVLVLALHGDARARGGRPPKGTAGLRASSGRDPRSLGVFEHPNASAISATYFPPRLFNLKCPPKVAPKKPEPKAPRPKSEALPRKKKTKKEAEEREAEELEPKERKAEEREGKEREATKAQLKKEADEAKQERERRKKQAQEEESRRQRERGRPKVLPRDGVTAAWPSNVLPEQKREGVTAAWPSKVLSTARVLPSAGVPRPATTAAFCGLPAPKLAGGKDGAARMAVREPILKALLAYKKAKSEPEKEAHRRRLRELFEKIEASAAEPFERMLSTPNALAVTFRDVLHGDPLHYELLGILGKKYAPAPSQCAPAVPAPAPPPGVTLPGVTLTDEGSFDELHAVLEQRITALREGCERIVRFNLKDVKGQLLKLVSVLSNILTRAQRAKVAAFQETDATKRAEGLKKAGAAYTGLFYVTQLWQLYVNIALVADWADEKGVPSSITDKAEENPLAKRLLSFEKDSALFALTQAGLDADAKAMVAALPAATQAYELHVTSLGRWAASIERGAFLSKKVIQVADIAMIAISIHHVAKMPVVPAGSSPIPPTILGALPGGAAVGSVVSLPSLARAVEAIRKLVASGALDGALIAGLGNLGGGPSIALPELQRPTSLSVQGPGGGSGSTGPQAPPTSKSGAEAVKDALSKLRPGRRSSVKVIDSTDEMAELFGRLRAGGKSVQGSTYPGELVELPDGTRIGFRAGSKSGGSAIDIWFPDGIERKVHLK